MKRLPGRMKQHLDPGSLTTGTLSGGPMADVTLEQLRATLLGRRTSGEELSHG
jgi:hypothetical protein